MIDSLKAHGIDLSKSGYDAYLAELLHSVGLDPDVVNRFPHELSGGMKQRVCIATAISLRPRVIIADEPTSALDVVVQRRVMETLRTVQNELGCAVILIGHDMGLMAQFAQRVAVMRHGQILEENGVHEIFANPQHPYTRLLMESLPSLERRESYQDLVKLESVAAAAVGAGS
jgi:peptide/nickel transport system ATP-binding protein